MERHLSLIRSIAFEFDAFCFVIFRFPQINSEDADEQVSFQKDACKSKILII